MLLKIYRATLLMGLLPRKWLDVKVIFIPKNGKKKYDEPSAWRPIALMQHMHKGEEKILKWDNETVVSKPLHLNQHGFRQARSTVSGLSSLVGKIEHAVAKLGFAMVTFADIKSAFDYA